MMEKPAVAIFQNMNKKSWLIVFFCFLYFGICWIVYSFAVSQSYGVMAPPGIGADSGSYFISAGLSGADRDSDVDQGSLVNFGGSSLGPVAVALVFRTVFGVACFNCALFLVMVWWAGMIPGVRREYFVLLMAIEPQTLPTLMTLNKEMMGIAGLVAFAAYLYGGRRNVSWSLDSPRGSKWLLFAAFVLSVLARWEQILIPMWYLAAQSRHSPIRGKPRWAVVALLMVCSVGWFAGVHILHLNLGGFIAAVEGGSGTITRLYAIQEKGGYFLVAFPKILMNLGGRWVTPSYFLGEYWQEDFGGSWQNAYVGPLSSLCMLCVLAYAFLRGRYRLSRPLIHVTTIYFICTAVLPFVQHRYIYPAYVLLALEMSRRQEALEPVKALWKPPALAPSYRAIQLRANSSAK